ncbi:MAG: Hsp20/alpha crystallin family protein [Nostocaceae cyanobacterium]|nr:Hsp20/alpha crystallin family protein [Nostocaceae cyanobacterium]
MSLIHHSNDWHPLKELDTLRKQMNRLFDEWIHGEPRGSLVPKIFAWEPAIELQETDTDIILKAEVPGIEPQDLDIEVTPDAVSIAGEHKEEQRTEEKGLFRSEFHYGKFHRIVPLPVSIENEQVTADFQHGVLTLTLPKVQMARRNVVKVDLSVQEKARQEMIKQRQHQEHLQQTMHTRALEELEKTQVSNIKEEARESVTEERQHEEHLEETMHSRSAAEVGVPNVDQN